MGKAARAIIIQGDNILVMRRNKQGADYYTLIGGKIDDNETQEQALGREVKEETGLNITTAKLVFVEEHPAPYNEQYIFFCETLPNQPVAIQGYSEEASLNKLGFNTHEPVWASIKIFPSLAFRTPQLQNAIVKAISDGFPSEPVRL